jgi:hypothetical protein
MNSAWTDFCEQFFFFDWVKVPETKNMYIQKNLPNKTSNKLYKDWNEDL